jgi:hypothetical protein
MKDPSGLVVLLTCELTFKFLDDKKRKMVKR